MLNETKDLLISYATETAPACTSPQQLRAKLAAIIGLDAVSAAAPDCQVQWFEISKSL